MRFIQTFSKAVQGLVFSFGLCILKWVMVLYSPSFSNEVTLSFSKKTYSSVILSLLIKSLFKAHADGLRYDKSFFPKYYGIIFGCMLLIGFQCWEKCIPLSKELADLYERQVYDFIKLSDVHKRLATFYDNILTGIRLESEYFRVGCYGTGFPSFLRVSSVLFFSSLFLFDFFFPPVRETSSSSFWRHFFLFSDVHRLCDNLKPRYAFQQ